VIGCGPWAKRLDSEELEVWQHRTDQGASTHADIDKAILRQRFSTAGATAFVTRNNPKNPSLNTPSAQPALPTAEQLHLTWLDLG